MVADTDSGRHGLCGSCIAIISNNNLIRPASPLSDSFPESSRNRYNPNTNIISASYKHPFSNCHAYEHPFPYTIFDCNTHSFSNANTRQSNHNDRTTDASTKNHDIAKRHPRNY